ncbi:hypothetical protein D3C76_565970 [compost metagenome]
MIADLEDLLEAVGDVDDAAALLAQLADDHEQLLGLGVGQGIGGLVHDDDAGIERQRLGDLHHLLLADGEIPEPGVRPVFDAETGQEGAGPLAQLLVVYVAKAGARLAAEEDVGGNGELRQQVQLLVDDADPLILGVAGTLEVHRLAAIADAARIGLIDAGQHLHQGGFAGAIFTEQGHHLARIDSQTCFVEGADTGEGLDDPGELQNGRGGRIDAPGEPGKG